MARAHLRRSGWAVTAAVAVSLASFTGLPATAAPAAKADDVTASEALAKRLGFQSVPKRTSAQKGLKGAAKANPYLSTLTDPSQSDMHFWKSKIEAKSKERTAAKRSANKTKAEVEPLLVDEAEPDAVRGGNDTAANAQLIPKFGSASGKRPAARILGTLAPSANAATFTAPPEDNGAIPLAGNTGLVSGAQRGTSSTIGDGPHGSAGDGTGDFDFYAVRGAKAGQRLLVDTDTVPVDPFTDLDTVVILWDAEGNALDGNDDDGETLDSRLSVTLPEAGDYFISVQSFGSLPGDPFDSGSGPGVASEGDYDVTFGLDASDVDFYAVNLKAGDVLSGSVSGAGTRLAVFDSSVREVFGSGQDASSLYPMVSPLAGGGNAVVDHVVNKSGRYYVATEGTTGNYSITLEVYRSGPERKKATQTIFLDFNGQRVNTAIFGGPGVTTLSPLSAFLGRWGIPASQQNALINRVIATTTENLKNDFAGTGVKIKILNSRDDADPFGQPNVSRLIVGGTIAESGVDTIGIAQSIDPGNYDTAETALILLDLLSDPAGEDAPYSLNTYLTSASNKVKFVGTALGNVASHEAGHYLGNWHVDQFNEVLNLMDQGGNFPLLYGVGADGVGGTADDPDVDFGEDTLNPGEGFSGIEDTRTRTRWGLTR